MAWLVFGVNRVLSDEPEKGNRVFGYELEE